MARCGPKRCRYAEHSPTRRSICKRRKLWRPLHTFPTLGFALTAILTLAAATSATATSRDGRAPRQGGRRAHRGSPCEACRSLPCSLARLPSALRAPPDVIVASRGPSLRVLKHQSHRLRYVAEAVALLGEMTDAGPRQMVDERRHALGCEHVHDLNARLDALLGIGVEADLHARFLHQDNMVHEVANDEERLAARINHKAGMSDRVPRGIHRLDAGKDLLAILVKHDAVPVRDQVLARRERGAFRRSAEPLVVGPEFQVGLGNIDLRVGEVAAAI